MPLPSLLFTTIAPLILHLSISTAFSSPPSIVPDLEILSDSRIAALPAPQRAAWESYLSQSRCLAAAERSALARECLDANRSSPLPAPRSKSDFRCERPPSRAILTSPAARLTARALISWQTPSGAWSKAVDCSSTQRLPAQHWTSQTGDGWHYCGTLDNRTTISQLIYLAAFTEATSDPEALLAVTRGLSWLFSAQFPNGGFPQVFPLEPGYHEAITLNDDAMTHTIALLDAAASGTSPWSWLDPSLRSQCAASRDAAIRCLLDCQYRHDGQLTIWAAQHDPLSLAPIAARRKEPASLSGSESSAWLKWLMRHGPLTSDSIAAVSAALKWLAAHPVTGLRHHKAPDGTHFLPDPLSKEIRWARFYHPSSAHPLFYGSDDGKSYPDFESMRRHNRVAYDYFTDAPASLLASEHQRWLKRLARAGLAAP